MSLPETATYRYFELGSDFELKTGYLIDTIIKVRELNK